MIRLRAAPLSQRSPSRERTEIGEKKKSAPRKNWDAPNFRRSADLFFSLVFSTTLGKRDSS